MALDSTKITENLKLLGCDTDNAVARFVGDIDLYMSCLTIFSEDKYFAQLRQQMSEKNYNGAFGSAHTLKGVAGNLGLTPLFDALSELMKRLNSNQFALAAAAYGDVDAFQQKLVDILNE